MRWVVVLFFYSVAFAADPSVVREIFEARYHDQYEPRYCGKNILGLLQEVDRRAGDTDGLYLVSIENKGFSVFGMVNAEQARSTRFGRPSAEEANWYHHVIAVHSSGLVYDFDFLTTPTVLPIEAYLERMFLDEPECAAPQAGRFCVGRKAKLQDYEFSILEAVTALTEKKPRESLYRMEDFQRDWRKILRPRNGGSNCADALASPLT